MTSVDVANNAGITTVHVDDGKANALTVELLGAIEAALVEAEQRGDVVAIWGRPGMFSGGFDLKVLARGMDQSVDMVMAGFRLARHLLTYPRPVVVGCTGHAVAMGAFLLLAADHRVGIRGDARITVNEVAIGMTMPHTPLVLMEHRLTPAARHQAAALARAFDPLEAVAAGFLDELVDPADIDEHVMAVAERLAKLHRRAHRETKQRLRKVEVTSLDAALEADTADFLDIIAHQLAK
jgi:enoyl-CoA hydratase